jgi:hypothetical protein
VAQHLRDLRQRRTLAQHSGRRGVPQAVRTNRRDARSHARVVHHAANRIVR